MHEKGIYSLDVAHATFRPSNARIVRWLSEMPIERPLRWVITIAPIYSQIAFV
jgi:hypothetical protein